MTEYYDFNEHSPQASPRMTWATQRIILLNIAFFALQLISDPLIVFFMPSGQAMNEPIGGFLTYWLAFNPGQFLQAWHGWIWTPITYQFMHGGLMHLLMNMIWLYFCAPEVERTLGTRQFYKFYLFCGVGGVLVNMLPYFTMGFAPPIVGASGAALGVVVAFAMLQPNRKFYLIPIPFPITAKGLVILILCMNLLHGMGESRIAWLTHLGGMGCGYLYMKMLPRWNKLRREKRAKQKETPNDPKKEKVDNIAEAVDNIFQFDDKNKK